MSQKPTVRKAVVNNRLRNYTDVESGLQETRKIMVVVDPSH